MTGDALLLLLGHLVLFSFYLSIHVRVNANEQDVGYVCINGMVYHTLSTPRMAGCTRRDRLWETLFKKIVTRAEFLGKERARPAHGVQTKNTLRGMYGMVMYFGTYKLWNDTMVHTYHHTQKIAQKFVGGRNTKYRTTNFMLVHTA